jgi:hypothetical protein
VNNIGFGPQAGEGVIPERMEKEVGVARTCSLGPRLFPMGKEKPRT